MMIRNYVADGVFMYTTSLRWLSALVDLWSWPNLDSVDGDSASQCETMTSQAHCASICSFSAFCIIGTGLLLGNYKTHSSTYLDE